MTDLFGNELPVPLKSGKPGKPKTNPLIPVYGAGPYGKYCRDCAFQFFRQFSKSYSKCEKREVSSSPKTDHNSRYHSCGQFLGKPTGNIWVRCLCKSCGHLSEATSQPQQHHDNRMIEFGWEKTQEGSVNQDQVWIRPIQSCAACPPKTKSKKR